ncbi:M48 family metalloprotease [Streptomyces diastaticus]|uniref:M48 family metalloprotease n=1 Tax=Streptomyces diastaticus TaxID=1956 RepID=UPI0037D2823D
MPLTPRPPDSFDPPSSAEPTRYPDPPYPESAPPPYPKPGAGPPPAGPLAIPPQPPAPAPRHAHRLCTDQRRVHLRARQRHAELRADQHAAALGFAPMLASVLHQMHEADQAARHQAALAARAAGTRLPEESAMAKLLATHPDHHTRLHHLQPWLQPRHPR